MAFEKIGVNMSDRIGSILKNLQKEASKGGEPFYADNIGEILKNKKRSKRKRNMLEHF